MQGQFLTGAITGRLLSLMVKMANQLRFGYVYLTRISTPKGVVMWYVGKRTLATFDPRYYGSGTVVTNVRKKHGSSSFKVRALKWCCSEEELNSEEARHIELARAKFGSRCVNISEGGVGWASSTTKLMWKRPLYIARQAAVFEKPDVLAKISAASKAAHANPETQRKRSAGLRAAFAKPEYKAKVQASRAARRAQLEPLKSRCEELHARLKELGYSPPRTTQFGYARLSAHVERWQIVLDSHLIARLKQ